jgi:hypothetical protein
LVVGLCIVAFTNNNINDTEHEIDVQIETMKNLIVIFSSTFLLLYVVLSIFRFQHFLLQILLALLVVVVFNVISIYLRRWFSKLWDKISFNQSMFVSFSSIYLYLVVFALFFIIVFFNFPKVTVNRAINLNNSNSYFALPNGSTDLVNRYKLDEVIDIQVDMEMDRGAYINQDDGLVFIHIKENLVIYDIHNDEMIYSGLYQDEINGISISRLNQEVNETTYQTYCRTDSDCNEYSYPYQYGDVEYKTFDKITKFDQLNYVHSDTGIFVDDIVHLFDNEAIDSRVSTISNRPFIGFGDSNALVTDIDNHDGALFYLQVEEDKETLNIQVFEIIEKDVDLVLPFYSHYRFGMLIFILFIGFVPITNYDTYRNEY